MDSKKHSEDSFQLYHYTLKSLPGALNWYGNDYLSFATVLDQMVQRLKASRLKNSFTFTVHLPDESFKNLPLEEWKNNYCIEKTLEHQAEYQLMKRQGYKFLLKGLIFLWACLSTVYLLDQLNALGDDHIRALVRKTPFEIIKKTSTNFYYCTV